MKWTFTRTIVYGRSADGADLDDSITNGRFSNLEKRGLKFEQPTQADLLSASICRLSILFLIRTLRGMEEFRSLLRGPLFRFRLLRC